MSLFTAKKFTNRFKLIDLFYSITTASPLLCVKKLIRWWRYPREMMKDLVGVAAKCV